MSASPALNEARLLSRRVLHVAGSDAVKFLQGLLTKDVSSLEHQIAAPLYAAMLNSKGRTLYDLLLYRDATHAAPSLFIDCDAGTASDLVTTLTRFKLRADVTVEDASSDMVVTARWGFHDQSAASNAELPKDPRLSDLGHRGPLASSAPTAGAEPSKSEVSGGAAAAADRMHRYRHGVAEGAEEIPSGSAIPLEYNINLLNGVTFDKGCYVGQELVARTHFQGLVRKRLWPVLLTNGEGCSVATGDEVFVEGKKKSIGTVRGMEAQHGLALLRVADAFAALRAGSVLQVGAERRPLLLPTLPAWWPDEVLKEGGEE